LIINITIHITDSELQYSKAFAITVICNNKVATEFHELNFMKISSDPIWQLPMGMQIRRETPTSTYQHRPRLIICRNHCQWTSLKPHLTIPQTYPDNECFMKIVF